LDYREALLLRLFKWSHGREDGSNSARGTKPEKIKQMMDDRLRSLAIERSDWLGPIINLRDASGDTVLHKAACIG
tara:strand:+ start:2649 stop:2873 length:225 start_codon:yes stop_codon:yes gene_type:complete